MKLTKDECYIISDVIAKCKHDYSWDRKEYFEVLSNLESKLDQAGEDQRRKGRTSQNTFSDIMKRLYKKLDN